MNLDGQLPSSTEAETPLEITELKLAEEKVRESEERFRLLIESVKDYAIFMLDPEGRVLTWNAGAERIKGYRAEEIVGKHYSIFFPAEDAQSGTPDLALKTAAAEGRVEREGWRLRKDGSRFWADVVVTAVRNPDGSLRGFSKVTRDASERKQAEESLRELSSRLLSVQDEERRRIARELHDSTAQTLSALSINLALMQQYIEPSADPRVSTVLRNSLALADQVSREIRGLSYLLHPPLLDEAGLADTLRWYIYRFTQRTKIEVDLQISPSEFDRLERDMELALFRVIQECLANVYRHSGSRLAGVRLVREPAEISLQVWDEGKGLGPDTPVGDKTRPPVIGVGIRGMKERVRQLGGRMEIRARHPGTVIEIVLPLH
jgi:PAS domain S-box-containing protein